MKWVDFLSENSMFTSRFIRIGQKRLFEGMQKWEVINSNGIKLKRPTVANDIANVITVSRIILTIVFALCLLNSSNDQLLNTWAIVILLIIIISDYLDGAIAKKWGAQTALGSFLDPVADKICIDISFVIITVKYDLSIWPAIILVSRDMIVLCAWWFFLFVLKKPFMAIPNLPGKIMVSLQMITILFVVIELQREVIRWTWGGSIIFSLTSLYIYAIHIDKYRKIVG